MPNCSSASKSEAPRQRARFLLGTRTRTRGPANPLGRAPPPLLPPPPPARALLKEGANGDSTHLCKGGNSSTSRRATPKRDLGCKPGRRPSCCLLAPALRHGPRRRQRVGARRARNFSAAAASQFPPCPRREAAALSGSQSHFGEEGRGAGGEGGPQGAEFQSPAVRGSPRQRPGCGRWGPGLGYPQPPHTTGA